MFAYLTLSPEARANIKKKKKKRDCTIAVPLTEALVLP